MDSPPLPVPCTPPSLPLPVYHHFPLTFDHHHQNRLSHPPYPLRGFIHLHSPPLPNPSFYFTITNPSLKQHPDRPPIPSLGATPTNYLYNRPPQIRTTTTSILSSNQHHLYSTFHHQIRPLSKGGGRD